MSSIPISYWNESSQIGMNDTKNKCNHFIKQHVLLFLIKNINQYTNQEGCFG